MKQRGTSSMKKEVLKTYLHLLVQSHIMSITFFKYTV